MSKSPLFFLVLGTAALVVGGVAVMFSDDDTGESVANVVDIPEARSAPRIMALTPHERRLKGRLEASKRKIDEYRRQGKVLENGTIVVPDVDGSPLYIHPELIEGVGRYGEPLYAMARYKRRAGVPVRKEVKAKLPDHMQPKLTDMSDTNILSFGTKPGTEGPTATDSLGDGGDGENSGSKGGGNKPNKPKGGG